MTEHKKQLMERWSHEVDDQGNRDESWREALPMEDVRFLDRLDEMQADFWAETNDPESEEWREDLTPEEEEIVRAWDEGFLEGYTQLLQDLVSMDKGEPYVSVDCRIAASKAEQLRQRAAKLPDTEDITRRLKAIEEDARRPRKAEEGQAKGKDLANELNALEADLRAREAKAKREQKQDMAMVNAAGDLADSLTKGLSR